MSDVTPRETEASPTVTADAPTQGNGRDHRLLRHDGTDAPPAPEHDAAPDRPGLDEHQALAQINQYLNAPVVAWDAPDDDVDDAEDADEDHEPEPDDPPSIVHGQAPQGKLKCRTLFLSDIHLGTRGCQAQALSKFLKRVRPQKLYLVGDIIDLWRLRHRWYWPQPHNEVVRRILKIAKRGTEVILVPGNHDESLRQFTGLEFGGVQLKLIDVHETADGRRLLITHGDQYDLVVQNARLLSVAGAMAYDWLLWLNTWYNRIRRAMGLSYWSLSHFVKMKVKSGCTFISRFEQTLQDEAQRRELDGVVCGHIHKAESDETGSVQYYNCGDWVESGTVLVEHYDGRVEVLDGLAMVGERQTATPAAALPEPVAATATS